MKRKLFFFGIAAAFISLLLLSAACSDNNDNNETTPAQTAAKTATKASTTGTASAAGNVDVVLAEYRVQATPASVQAGTVAFSAQNIGSTDHELVIIKTDLPEADLPTKADGSVDETGSGVETVDKIEEFASGGTEELTTDLEPGSYVLLCNVVQTTNGQTVSHYAQGMHTAFTVTQ